jgi:hypothetical protein
MLWLRANALTHSPLSSSDARRSRFAFSGNGFGDRACNGRSTAGEAHTFENFSCIDRWMYCRKNPETPTTIGTLQNVNFENPRHQGSPGVIPGTPHILVSVVVMVASIGFDFWRNRNNRTPPFCRRTEQPMKNASSSADRFGSCANYKSCSADASSNSANRASSSAGAIVNRSSISMNSVHYLPAMRFPLLT